MSILKRIGQVVHGIQTSSAEGGSGGDVPERRAPGGAGGGGGRTAFRPEAPPKAAARPSFAPGFRTSTSAPSGHASCCVARRKGQR